MSVKNILMILIACLILSGCASFDTCRDLPEEYAIRMTHEGKYITVWRDTNTPIYWEQGSGTRCEAIDRAIEQEQYRISR